MNKEQEREVVDKMQEIVQNYFENVLEGLPCPDFAWNYYGEDKQWEENQ